MSFPRYPAYKPSGVEWLGEVPEHWDVLPLKRRSRLLTEKTECRDNPVALENIEGWTGCFVETDTEFQGEGIAFEPGDILFGKLRPYLAKVYLAANSGQAVGDFHVIHPLRGLNSRFLQLALLTRELIDLVNGSTFGAKMPRASWDFLGSLPLCVPPLDEQSSITTFLDRETAKIDALIAEQQRLIALLQEKRQAVISHAVTKGLNPHAPMKDSGVEWLGEVPEHWEVMQLSKLINKITNGYVGPTRDILVDNGVRYLQSLHIKNNRIIFDAPYYVSRDWSLSKEKSILREGDVLIVQTGDIGQSAVVTKEFEGCNCHALIVISPRKELLSGDWLSWVLNSAFGKETLLSIQTGALHPHLNCGNVKYINIPVAPKGEQVVICEHIQAKNEEFDRLIVDASSFIDLMTERRSALISAAVTGQIDVRGLVPEAEAA